MAATGCSCDSETTGPGHKVNDAEATAAGVEAARSVIAVASDENALSDRLLEVRSEIYDLSKSRGDIAADDFEKAFEDYIRQHNDSLARILF